MTRLTITLVVLVTTSPADAEIIVSADFEGGSAVLLSKDDDSQVVHIQPRVQPGRGWPCWWYCRIDGLSPEKPLKLKVSAATEPFRDKRVLDASWVLPDQVAFSTDNEQWRHTPRGNREGKSSTYEIDAKAKTVWVAWGPPFLPSHAEKLLHAAKRKLPKSEVFTLAKTREGRPVPAIRFGAKSDTAQHGVWIQARQFREHCLSRHAPHRSLRKVLPERDETKSRQFLGSTRNGVCCWRRCNSSVWPFSTSSRAACGMASGKKSTACVWPKTTRVPQ